MYKVKRFSQSQKIEAREFGVKSKVLYALNPGGYNNKEAIKEIYGEDSEEYRDRRLGASAVGAFSPITSSVNLHKIKKMKKAGASKDEMRKYMRKMENVALGEGVAHVLTGGGTATLGSLGAYGHGAYHKFTKDE